MTKIMHLCVCLNVCMCLCSSWHLFSLLIPCSFCKTSYPLPPPYFHPCPTILFSTQQPGDLVASEVRSCQFSAQNSWNNSQMACKPLWEFGLLLPLWSNLFSPHALPHPSHTDLLSAAQKPRCFSALGPLHSLSFLSGSFFPPDIHVTLLTSLRSLQRCHLLNEDFPDYPI